MANENRIADFLIDATDVAGAVPIKWIVWYDEQFREKFQDKVLRTENSLKEDPDLLDTYRRFMTPPLLQLLREALGIPGFYDAASDHLRSPTVGH